MYQALYRKYRPSCFADVVGQEHITDILRSELRQGKIFHAYLFTGPRGTGKTSCAKILAKAVNCLSPVDGDACCKCDSCRAIENGDVLDITEIDAASNNGVENIRDLREQVSYTPSSSKYRVYIIDEVHMLSIGAFNALLKTLEEPPPHIVFILATTEVHKLPATILSRCQRFDFHRIPTSTISDRLIDISGREGFTLERPAADMIAALSDGGMRDALSTLDLCAAKCGTVTEDDVMQVCSLAGENYCAALAGMIKDGDCGAALGKIDELHKNAVDLMRLCSELVTYYRNLLIAKTVKNPEGLIVTSPKVLEEIKAQAADYPIEGIVNAINVLTAALDRMPAADRRTELETAVVRLCRPQLGTSPSALLDRLERIERTLKYAAPAAAAVASAAANGTAAPAPSAAGTAPDNDSRNDDCITGVPDDDITSEPDADRSAAATEPTQPAAVENEKTEPFEAWQDVIAELVHSAPLMAASLGGSKAYVKGELLLIDSANDQFFSLMRSEDPIYRRQIKSAVMQVVGRTYRLGPYKTKKEAAGDPLRDVMEKLKKLEVPQK